MSKTLQLEDKYFRSLFDHSPTSIQLYGVDGFLKGYNRAFEVLFDVTAAPYVGVYNVFTDEQLLSTGIVDLIRNVIAGETVHNLISRYDASDKQGRERWLRTSMFPVKLESGEVIDFVIMHEDITDLKDHERYLERVILERTKELERVNRELLLLAQYDPLTALYNRRSFDTRYNMECEHADATGMPLAMVLIDVDYFKNYNDQYGHLVGDHCLRAVAETIKNCLKGITDAAFRYGGDEFAILLPETTGERAYRIAENIREAVVARDLPNEASPMGRITLSLGVMVAHGKLDQHQHQEEFFAAVDRALYQAKSGGKNQTLYIE